MSNDVKRNLELFLVQKLKEHIPMQNIVPFGGGGEAGESEELEPPLIFVAVSEAERRKASENVYYASGSIVVVNYVTDDEAGFVSSMAAQITGVLEGISGQVSENIVLHGIDISATRRDRDSDARLVSETVDFTAGVTG